MGRDVFISYSRQDVNTAEEVCAHMEARGITCWIAPRDVDPGAEFDQAILDAIDESHAVVLVLSESSNSSRFVQSEINRAFARGKSIFTFRVSDVIPSRQLELYVARQQWLDGFPPPIERKLDRLASAVLALLGLSGGKDSGSPSKASPNRVEHAPDPPPSAKCEAVARRFLDWLHRYDHMGETPTESFKSFIVADKCIVEYGVTYAEYKSVGKIVALGGTPIEWTIPQETFEFLVAESKRVIETYKA